MPMNDYSVEFFNFIDNFFFDCHDYVPRILLPTIQYNMSFSHYARRFDQTNPKRCFHTRLNRLTSSKAPSNESTRLQNKVRQAIGVRNTQSSSHRFESNQPKSAAWFLFQIQSFEP